MENLTPCKIVTPANFILKLGTRDYVENVTYYTIFDVDRFSGCFSPNRFDRFRPNLASRSSSTLLNRATVKT